MQSISKYENEKDEILIKIMVRCYKEKIHQKKFTKKKSHYMYQYSENCE